MFVFLYDSTIQFFSPKSANLVWNQYISTSFTVVRHLPSLSLVTSQPCLLLVSLAHFEKNEFVGSVSNSRTRLISPVMLSPRFLSPFTQARYPIRALGFELFNALFRPWATNESPKPVQRRFR